MPFTFEREFWTQIFPVYSDRPLPERYFGEYNTRKEAEANAMFTNDVMVGRIARMRVTVEEQDN
jgi:hypothetical protein